MGTIITGGLTKNYHTMSHREKILFSPPEFLNNNQAKNKMAAENDDSTYFYHEQNCTSTMTLINGFFLTKQKKLFQRNAA